MGFGFWVLGLVVRTSFFPRVSVVTGTVQHLPSGLGLCFNGALLHVPPSREGCSRKPRLNRPRSVNQVESFTILQISSRVLSAVFRVQP